MDITKLFGLIKNSQFQYFEGNFFNSNGKDVEVESSTEDTNTIQLYFSTVRGGRGKSISIESCENNLFDVTLYITNETEEILGITEEELFNKLTEILKT